MESAAEYPRTSQVLQSAANTALLEAAVRDMAAAEGMVVSSSDVSHAVAAQVQTAVDRNITGARYLTNASILAAANEYIAMHALRDIRHLVTVSASPQLFPEMTSQSAGAPLHENATVRTARRREVRMREASSAWPALPPAPQRLREDARTPRTLLNLQ